MAFWQDVRFAARSLWRSKGLTITVVLTLALGIGANAAIFSLVRGVLLRPLANRDEDRLVYIRQTAQGIGAENATFSVPEIQDLRDRVRGLSSWGDFSTIPFTLVGLGEPREVRSGVVGGTYFEVMGLHPVLGRLLGPDDDGPNAEGAVVLTHRFWTTALQGDPSVIGKTVRLGSRSATVIGVLEPSVPYPAETEIVANVVTSPHHLSATMVTGRVHRMTELFARLGPGVDLEAARAELRAVHEGMRQEHPEAYPPNADFRIEARLLREQITARARTVLLVLLAASGLVFVIACCNVANLVLARAVRREGELAIRAALGASRAALRRTLLAESLLLAGAGAALGVLSARPMVAILARYASRFSVRALDLTVDATLLWVGAGLALLAAVGARVRAAPSLRGRRPGARRCERQLPHHGQHEPAPADLRGDADRRVLRAPRGREHAPQGPPRPPVGGHGARRAQGAGPERPRGFIRPRGPRQGPPLLQGGHAADLRSARGRPRGRRHPRTLAGRGVIRPRLPVHGGRLRARPRRARSPRTFPHRLPGFLRGARRAPPRRPRLRRVGSPRQEHPS